MFLKIDLHTSVQSKFINKWTFHTSFTCKIFLWHLPPPWRRHNRWQSALRPWRSSWGTSKLERMRGGWRSSVWRACADELHCSLLRAGPRRSSHWCLEKWKECGAVTTQSIIDGLVQDCSISSALALEILKSCTKPSIFSKILAFDIP